MQDFEVDGEQVGKRSTFQPAAWRKASAASHLLGCVWPCACHRRSGCSGRAARSPRAGAAGAGCALPAPAPGKTGSPVAAEGSAECSVLVDPAHSE